MAEGLREIESRVPSVKKLKYSLHPLLSSFHKRLDQSVRRSLEQADPLRYAFLTGGRENTALQEALFDDGFAFTEQNIADFDFNNFLASNKRYRLPSDVFFEVYSILYKETERRLREGDRGLLARVARHMGLPKEQLQTQAGVVKVMMNSHVITYLLGDAWGTGARLLASPRLKQEAERRRPAEILDVYNDLITGLKRFELVAHLREKVNLVRGFGEGGADEGMTKRRVFEFGDAAQVLNNAVNATASSYLRGFTETPRATSPSATSPRSSTPCSTSSCRTCGASAAPWTSSWATGSSSPTAPRASIPSTP